MDNIKHLEYLRLMDVDVWEQRSAKPNLPQVEQLTMPKTKKEITSNKDERLQRIAQMNWNELEAEVAQCKACPLHKTRIKSVFGVGNKQAELLVIGEAPGANEDKQGEPFVGRAGQLLNSMLLAIGLNRQDVFIANVVKSRPPENRDPTPEEVAACIPFLQRQIQLIKPKLILTVGRIAAQHLLGINDSMAQMRGREYKYGEMNIRVIVTYHPAYLLRSPREKRKAWVDMENVAKRLASH